MNKISIEEVKKREDFVFSYDKLHILEMWILYFWHNNWKTVVR